MASRNEARQTQGLDTLYQYLSTNMLHHFNCSITDIFNTKMLHQCPLALGNNSNPIVGHRWIIDAHRKKLRWPSMSPSMGMYGVLVRVGK